MVQTTILRQTRLTGLLICSYLSLTLAQSSYWLANINHLGTAAYNPDNSYTVFRNVKDFGAVGNGATDDTAAINNAISAGSRCGDGQCSSSTTKPAIIYFPPGIYRVTSPIVMYYFSDVIGDPTNPPTVIADPAFEGLAVFDSDVYIPGGYGAQWYGNTNNFYRKVRNFVIDLTQMPYDSNSAGIHWQVAQGTSLQNIVFKMRSDGGDGNKQQGIFMENGSGGFMTDLTFYGGNYGAFFGNQQFTSRNLTFVGCRTAIYMNWNWLWTLSGLKISGAVIGIDMSNSINPTPGSASVSSVLVMDSAIQAKTGILTRYGDYEVDDPTASSLSLENVDFANTDDAVLDLNYKRILGGGSVVQSWGQGSVYSAFSTPDGCQPFNSTIQGPTGAITRQSSLTTSSGIYFQRSKPQYETLPATSFLSAKAFGCRGDGVSDDSTCVQNFLNAASSSNRVAFFDHGAYVVSQTITVTPNIRIVGEVWPTIMATGSLFSDQNSPQPVFQVGTAGSEGLVEIQDIVFSSIGPVPGAIMVQWNLRQIANGLAGMWDVHFRIGGAAGTKMQSDQCLKTPDSPTTPNPACFGAFLLLHITSTASVYLENIWAWVADHDLDLPGEQQINIYNGRGILIENTSGPVWLWGTASEHNVLYNYQVSKASNVFLGIIQTETAYMQSNPSALVPFTPQTSFNDPTFPGCPNGNDAKTWGLRIVNSNNVYTYGAGLYSFFDNYDMSCIRDVNCQTNMVDVLGSSNVYFWGLTTIASKYMLTLQGVGIAEGDDNISAFGQTIIMIRLPDSCSRVTGVSSTSSAATCSSTSSVTPITSSSSIASSAPPVGTSNNAPLSTSSSNSAATTTAAPNPANNVPFPTTIPSDTNGLRTFSGTLAGSGVISGTGSISATGTISAVGSLSGTGTIISDSFTTSGVISTVGTISGSGLIIMSGTVVGSGAVSGSGSLSGIAFISSVSSTAMTSAASATGTVSAFGTIDATGILTSGSYSSSGVVARSGASISGSAGITGSGTVSGSATAAGTISGSGYMSGSGTIDATGYISASGVLSGSGYISSAGFERSGYVSTSGVVIGSGVIRGMAMSIAGQGYISGSGTMTGMGYASAGGYFPSATSFGGAGRYGTTVIYTIVDCTTIASAREDPAVIDAASSVAAAVAALTSSPLQPSAADNTNLDTASALASLSAIPTPSSFLDPFSLRQGQPPSSPDAYDSSPPLNSTLTSSQAADLARVLNPNSDGGGKGSKTNPSCPLCPADIAICCNNADCGADGKCPLDAVRRAGWMVKSDFGVGTDLEVVGVR